MKTVLFLDEICPKPYGPNQFEGNGGTERTVVKIAEAIAATGLLNVVVEQHNRTETSGRYVPSGTAQKADYVVCIRMSQSALEARKRFPKAKIYLWTHDLAGLDIGDAVKPLVNDKIDIVTVSSFHRHQTLECMKAYGYRGGVKLLTIYNPIDNDLLPDNTACQRNKLCFTASPHKGLKRTLELFSLIKSGFIEDAELVVTNPGYIPDVKINIPGVRVLGTLPHNEVMTHVRESLCLFYPNSVFPETFGLIMAEANAVGTPYLAHNFGAAAEISDHPYQTMDTRDNKRVIDRLMSWYEGGRPTVRGRDEFRLSNVLKQWYKLLKD